LSPRAANTGDVVKTLKEICMIDFSIEIWPTVIVNGDEVDCHFDEDRDKVLVRAGLNPEEYIRIGAIVALARKVPPSSQIQAQL